MNSGEEMKEDESHVKEATDSFVVKLRGMPWAAKEEDIEKFLSPALIVTGGIKILMTKEGRASGNGFAELASQDDLDVALTKHRNSMGSRYVEVYKSKKSEMDWTLDHTGNTNDSTEDGVVRLRGLPYGCSKEEVAQFFSGLEIRPNGITILHDADGRTSGDAYVQFTSPDIAEQALQKHKQRIGHRYIEIFKSSLSELRQGHGPMRSRGFSGPNRTGPYDRDRGFGRGGMMGSRGGMMGNPMMGGSMGNQNFPLNDYGEYLSNMIYERLKDSLGRQGAGNFSSGYGGSGNYSDNYSGGGNYGGSSANYGSSGNYGGAGGFSGGNNGSSYGGDRGGSGMRGGGDMDYRGDDSRRGAGAGGSSRGNPGSSYNSTTGYAVHMRGIPYQTKEADIRSFFQPLNPVHIDIEFLPNGRAAGKANVDFSTHEDALEAMKKHRMNMEHRYVELFLNSNAGGGTNRSGYGDSYNYRYNSGGNNYTSF